MASTLYIDESGREHVDPDFVVGGALVANRRALAARLHRIPFAWPFLDRPLHRAHLRSPGHLARRWSTWASLREVRDPSQDLGLFGGTPAERAGEMGDMAGSKNTSCSRHGWRGPTQTRPVRHWSPRPSSGPFSTPVLRPRTRPTSVSSVMVTRGRPAWAGRPFVHRPCRGFRDGCTHRPKPRRATGQRPGPPVAYTRDQPVGSTLGERDRYLRMLGATLQTGREPPGVSCTDPEPRHPSHGSPRASDLVRLHDKHIRALGMSIRTERVSFWKHATPGDEAADLLLGAVRRGGLLPSTPSRPGESGRRGERGEE